MARDPQIEQRLMRWAQWVTVGDGAGYPAMSVLHKDWSPPSPGVLPTLKVAAGTDVRQTHRLIGKLSQRLANTLVVHYCIKGTLEEQAARLDCAPRTVHERVETAHRMLQRLVADAGGEFCNLHEVG